jgi:CheY-like chemotaxis protein
MYSMRSTALACLFAMAGVPALAQQVTAPAESQPVQVPGNLTLEQVFADYLHFARMGSFGKAQAYGAALLARPDCKPEALLALADKYRNSRETLLMMISGSSIAESASQILKVIREGEVLKRKSPEQITNAIGLLEGTPTQREVGLDRLRYAGEYAIPWMVAWLADPSKKDLYPYIERALPKIGKPAVNPLVIALRMKNDPVRQTIMDALAELGYPQALPYLKRIESDPKQDKAVRETAAKAIAQIVASNPGTVDVPADQAFLTLAEEYYRDTPSLRPDEREELANVWYLKKDQLTAIAVPRQIFDDIMCMRCSEDALSVQPDLPPAVALWLAADFQREAKLGMNVQSVAPDEKGLADATRPENYPRSLYFARCFGPRDVLLTLARGVKDRDTPVTLGSVTALDGIASAAELLGTPGARETMMGTLGFPDILVRINAALTLARARPPQDFPGAQEVVPILSSALDLRGRPTVVIADPNADSRHLLEEAAAKDNATVIAAANFTEAAARARREATNADLILLATDLESPDVFGALQQIHRDNRLELVPVVLVVKPGGLGVAIKATEADSRIERIVVSKVTGLSNEELTQFNEAFNRAWARARLNYGLHEITEEEALRLSLAAADALRLIAVSGTSVFQFSAAEPALIRACSHPIEEMRLKAAAVLAWANSPAAQSTIAGLAINPAGSEAQRITAFGILADSAKRFGKLLAPDLMNAVTQEALHEPALAIRTAASQAFGALNVSGSLAPTVIREQSTD